jgi:hypothetical protein
MEKHDESYTQPQRAPHQVEPQVVIQQQAPAKEYSFSTIELVAMVGGGILAGVFLGPWAVGLFGTKTAVTAFRSLR